MGPLALVVLFFTGCLTAKKIADPPDGGTLDSRVPDGFSSEGEVTDATSGDRYLPDACIDHPFYLDADGDRFGDPSNSLWTCTQPEGYVDNHDDCNDTNNLVHPGAMEVVDGVDNDCDGIVDADSWHQASTGNAHSCGLRLDGSVNCWGLNDQGQAPAEVAGVFTQISTGSFHSCGLQTDGTILCWGRDAEGQSTLPATTIGVIFTQVSAGWDNTCGLTEGGTAMCWGTNEQGQSSPPDETYTEISAGWRHGCGIVLDKIQCWGLDTAGETMLPPDLTDISFTQISAGLFHSCGILAEDNTVRCWGNSNGGIIPSELQGASFIQINAGSYHTCGVMTSGAVACWHIDLLDPVSGLYRQVSSSKREPLSACAVTTDDTLHCWGNNDNGQAPDSVP